MRSIILYFTLFYSTTILAERLEITSMENDIFLDAKFKLAESSSDYLSLDCQSFFQKADFYKDNKLVVENYIDISQCQEIYKRAESCLKEEKSVCISSDYLFDKSCHCN